MRPKTREETGSGLVDGEVSGAMIPGVTLLLALHPRDALF